MGTHNGRNGNLLTALFYARYLRLVLCYNVFKHQGVRCRVKDIGPILSKGKGVRIRRTQAIPIAVNREDARAFHDLRARHEVRGVPPPVRVATKVRLRLLRQSSERQVFRSTAQGNVTSNGTRVPLKDVLRVRVATAFRFSMFTTIKARIDAGASDVIGVSKRVRFRSSRERNEGLVYFCQHHVNRQNGNGRPARAIFRHWEKVNRRMNCINVTRRVRISARHRPIGQPLRHNVRISRRLSVRRAFTNAQYVRRHVILYRRVRINDEALRVPRVGLAIGHGQVLTNNVGNGLVGCRLVILCLCQAIIRPMAYSHLTYVSERAIRGGVAVRLELIRQAVGVGPSVGVSNGNRHLIESRYVNRLR